MKSISSPVATMLWVVLLQFQASREPSQAVWSLLGWLALHSQVLEGGLYLDSDGRQPVGRPAHTQVDLEPLQSL